MKSTQENKLGVQGVTTLVRERINNSIGAYEKHWVDERGNYIVRLANGEIAISKRIAQNFEAQPGSISKEDLHVVAYSFIPVI